MIYWNIIQLENILGGRRENKENSISHLTNKFSVLYLYYKIWKRFLGHII